MIMTRASRRMFEALEPSDASSELPDWLVAVQAERAQEAARKARVVATLAASPLRDGYALYYPSK
jgi:hypothetical protein